MDNKEIEKHPLHVVVAKKIEDRFKGYGELEIDSACGGDKHLSLFIENEKGEPEKGNETRMCDVDLLFIVDKKVRVIVEIEESGFKPTKICGKFLQSAFAKYYIDDSRSEPNLPYGDNVLFIEVFDALKSLPQGSKKREQARNIETRIQNLLKIMSSTITEYHLFFIHGKNDTDGFERIFSTISRGVGL